MTDAVVSQTIVEVIAKNPSPAAKVSGLYIEIIASTAAIPPLRVLHWDGRRAT